MGGAERAQRGVVGPRGSLMAGAAQWAAGLSWRAGGAGKDRWGGAGLCGVGRALSRCSRPGGAAEKNPGGGIFDSKHWATLLLRWRGVRLPRRRCGVRHARLAGRNVTAEAGRGGAGGGGGGRETWAWTQAGWPDGACRDCNRRAPAAALAVPKAIPEDNRRF